VFLNLVDAQPVRRMARNIAPGRWRYFRSLRGPDRGHVL